MIQWSGGGWGGGGGGVRSESGCDPLCWGNYDPLSWGYGPLSQEGGREEGVRSTELGWGYDPLSWGV